MRLRGKKFIEMENNPTKRCSTPYFMNANLNNKIQLHIY